MARAPAVIVLAFALLVPGGVGAKDSPPVGPASRGEPDCSRPPSVWRRARTPSAGAYCAILLSATSRLAAAPKEAQELAERALELEPDSRRARVVLGQAQLLLGEPRKAHEIFEGLKESGQGQTSATTRDALGYPGDLAQAARAALLSGAYDIALGHYRRVILRLQEIPGARDQARLLIEAATAASYSAPNRGAEARGYLASAATRSDPLLRPIIEAAWALSFARDGERDRARALVAHVESSWQVRFIFDGRPVRFGRAGEVLPVLPAGEDRAYAAVVAQAVEPAAFSIHFQEFLDEGGPSLPAHLRVMPHSHE